MGGAMLISEFYTVLFLCSCRPVLGEDGEFLYGTFPVGFSWGLGTSAYQVEGAWDHDGRGPSIWDNFTQRDPSPVADGQTGNTACDSYHKFKEDVRILKELGANHYRFSLSWSRILPLGALDLINQPGIDYYNQLIDELLLHGVNPMVTIHHLDLPQALEANNGGWTEEDLIEHYVNFARLAFTRFGDRVKSWVTFNSPWITCWLGYSGVYAPGNYEPFEAPYKCGHNILKAHARVYRLYHTEFGGQGGVIGINFDTKWYEPASSKQEDAAAAQRALYFKFGWFVSPLIHGDYPPIMRELINRRSQDEGRNISRLPTFDPEDSALIQGSWDFIGLTHYTTELVANYDGDLPGWLGDQQTATFPDGSWPESGSSWLHVVPWGFRRILNWIKVTYDNPQVIITENGVSDIEEGLNDMLRIDYYRAYINQLLKAIVLDGCHVTAYTAWSLLDNFEWIAGFTERFGIYHVDFNSSNRIRTPKASAEVLTKIFEDNGFPKLRTDGGSGSHFCLIYVAIGIGTCFFVGAFVVRRYLQ